MLSSGSGCLRRWLTGLVAGICGCGLAVGCLRADEPVRLLTGSALQKALQSSVSWSADNVPLRSQLESLRQQTGILVLRDRRLDPRFPVSVDTGFVPRAVVLQQLAGAIPQCHSVVTDNYVLLGPADRVGRLPVLLKLASEQLNSWKKLPSNRLPRKAFGDILPAWSAGTAPREILERAAAECGIELENPELLSHDVWDAVSLPRMTFAELACLVLVQFDLQPELSVDKAVVRLRPIDPGAVLELKHSVSVRQKPLVQKAWQQLHPDAALKWSSANVVLSGGIDLQGDLLGILQSTAQARTTEAPVTEDSLRTRLFQLMGERVTVEYLVQEFRKNRIVIEIEGEETAEVGAVLKAQVDLAVVREKLPGLKFFPALFGRQFRRVEVRDDRVVLGL